MTSNDAAVILQRHAARNFWMNVLDGNAFILGISMLSRYTVLPLFVERLGGEAWLQGLIPTLFYVGWLLPGLAMAPIVASMPRRKPWIMQATLGERLPFLVLGVLLLASPSLAPNVLLTIFFALYTVYAFSAGLTSTAWQDFIARVIPEKRWGIFFGLQNGLGGILGVVGAAVATSILATQPFPQSVGILAVLCFVAMMCSYVFLGATVEPPQNVATRQPWREFLGGIMPLLRRDGAFRRYLFCRTAIALGFVGHSFLTAAALARFNVSNEVIGIYTGVLLAAQALANLGLGALADRWGHKPVLELSTGLGLAAMLVAVLAPIQEWYLAAFALVGAAQAGYTLSGFTLIFAFSTPAERPTYIGVANTALVPAAAFGPLLAGAFASLLGYSPLFVVLLLIGIVGLVALHLRVTLPTRDAAPVADV
jgi:MFS family permease